MKLDYFKAENFHAALRTFFLNLNIPVNYLSDEPTSAREILKDTWKDNPSFKLMNDVYFLGMVDDSAFSGNKSINTSEIKSNYDGVLIFGVTLNKRENNLLPTRSQLAEIARAFNREFFYTPVVVVYKYGKHLAFANTQRLKYKQEWREGEKAGKVSLLRDIDITNLHSGHERILNDLKIPTTGKNKVDSFAKLYSYWQDVFSVNILNKKFYQELSKWYFWAIKEVHFPSEPTVTDEHLKKIDLPTLRQEHNAKNVIRLLTRFLFVWFVKEKKLIPEELFDIDYLKDELLKVLSPVCDEGLFKEANLKSVYYKAILQNLFFASLNCPIEPLEKGDNRERGFRLKNNFGQHRDANYLMRYKDQFKNPEKFLKLINEVVPFLNGGLFECLDNKTDKIYIDGFSDNLVKPHQLIVPDYLFFGFDQEVDLSGVVGIKTKAYKKASVKGLIPILESYKFTIAENTPIEEDVALDPELLGKVFENLLASYNPETKTTARKQTGSFYTPREIVNYMVDESLIAYLKSTVSFQLTDKSKASFQLTDNQNTDNYLNPNDNILIKQGKLPHWTQDKVWYFVTFRLADSIPQEKIKQIEQEREQWLQKHRKENYSKEELIEYYSLFSERVEKWMNAGYGDCVLKDKNNAKIVADSMKYFEGKRYQLDEWVVMPNHVHVLVKPLGNNKLKDILHSWKSFTANKINKNIGKTGQLWTHEFYDHIVRNEKAFYAIKTYICQNPEKANIKVLEASSKVFKASSFKTETQSRDALDTMLHQLLSFDNINPFAENDDLQKQIIHSLDTCKILDPACGSGAFPMGILQKMVHILQKVDPENKCWQELQLNKAVKETEGAFTITDKKEREQKLIEINDAFDEKINDPDYARKLFLIEDCIYGVDIQPIATQISKLRFFISLIVDQKVDKDKPNFGIRALPNLETKFVAANSLIGINKPKDQMALFENQEVKELERELKNVRHRIFSAKSPATKRKLRNKDKKIRKKIGELLIKHGWANETAKQLAGWDPYDQNASSPFFDPEWMFGIKDGFDVVIGNPPYIKEHTDRTVFNGLRESEYYQGKMDLWYFFACVCIDLLKTKGALNFIATNNWITNSGASKFRNKILNNTKIKQFIDFSNFKIFESAGIQTMILISEKNRQNEEYSLSYSKLLNSNIEFNSLERFLANEINSDFIHFKSKIVKQLFLNKSLNFIPNYISEILFQIESKRNFKISEKGEINSGIDIPQDFINKSSLEILGKNFSIGDGVFVLSQEEVDNLCLDQHEKNLLKPFYTTKEFFRYNVNHKNNYWILYTDSSFKDPAKMNSYPKLKAHLDKFQKVITSENKPYGLNRARNEKYFKGEKILIQRKCPSKLSFVYVNFNSYINRTFIPLKTNRIDLKYLTGIFNSQLCQFWLKYKGKMQGDNFQVDKVPVIDIPIRLNANFEIISTIVLCSIFSSGSIQLFEDIIDALVFQLYFSDHMKKRNIDILQFVEKDIKEVIQNRDFAQLTKDQKEKVIKQLHKKWTDPKSEIVKRMNSFAEKSPDILKPILESR